MSDGDTTKQTEAETKPPPTKPASEMLPDASTRGGPPGRAPSQKPPVVAGAAAASPPDPPRIVSGEALDDAPRVPPRRGNRVNGEMLPIWFWVGVILTFYGAIVTALGLAGLGDDPSATVLGELHPRVWWGGIMLLFGLGLLLSQIIPRRRRRRPAPPEAS